MAKRFYSEFNNLRNEHFTIEIWDSSFASAATTFNPGADGFSISYKGDNQERTGTILATECRVSFRIETAEHDTFLADIIASKEGRFTLKITKGTGTPTLFWVGLIIADVGQYEEAYRPYFTLTAVDGLGLLKDEEYKNGANFYGPGKATLKDHLINALARLNYVSTHFATGERFLRIAVDWWEETMTNNTTNDPMALTWVDHSAWWTYNKEVQKARSCWEVLDNVLRCMGARITQHEGVFWVEQITYRTASTIVLRNYDKAGTYINSTNFSNANTINQTAGGALFNGGVYEFFPPLSEVRHTFEVDLRQNHIAAVSLSSGTGSVTVNKPIEANSGATTLRLTGNIALSIFNQSDSSNATTPRFAVFQCTLKVGSRWLKNTYTVQNYQVSFGPMSWETSASNFYLTVAMPNGVPLSGSGNTYNYSQLQDITTPPLPTGADSFQIGMVWQSLTFGDLSNFLKSFNFLNQWLEPYSYGNPALNDDEWEYVTTNPDVENTKIHETTCIIGNSTDPNAVGALWVKPSSTYILADDWQDGTDTPDRDIEKLNIELILGGQQQPIRRLSGTLYGTLTLLGRVVWDGANWLLLGGTYNAAQAQMQGEWFELNYDGAGLTTSGPIRKKTKKNPDVPPTDGGTNTTGKAAYQMNAAMPGTLLYPVAQTTTLNEIAAGAITNIDVTDALGAGDFYDGDTVVILNPVTGFFEELEVTVTSANGDDFITVNGTLTGSYPPNSPIIKKPLIGHPTVFGAGVANRLAYWVSESELNDLTAGTSGQYLKSNGTGAVPSWVDLSVPSSAVTGLTANLLLYGSGGGGIAQSANLTYASGYLTSKNSNASTSYGASAAQDAHRLQNTDTTDNNWAAISNYSSGGTIAGAVGWQNISHASHYSNFSIFTREAAGFQRVLKVSSTESEFFYPVKLTGAVTVAGASTFSAAATFNAGFTVNTVAPTINTTLTLGSSSVGSRLTVWNDYASTSPASSAAFANIVLRNRDATTNNWSAIEWDSNGGVIAADIAAQFVNHASNYADVVIHVRGSGGYLEALRVDSNRKVTTASTVAIGAVTGTPTTVIGRDGSGNVGTVAIGTGLSLSAGTLSATAGTNYQTLRDDGSAMTQRPNANFVSGSEITFTLTDDAGNTETEIAAALATNAVGNTKFRQSAGLSVVGRSANSTGDVADITAGTDGHVLRRSGTVLGFGQLNLADTNTVSGSLQVGNGGTGLIALGSANQMLRVNAGATSLEYFTPTFHTGSLTATRIPFATSSTVLDDDAALTWDDTNKRLQVGVGGTTTAYLNLMTSTSLGTATEFLRVSAANTSNNIVTMLNTSNANTGANMILQLSSGGASGGDPMIQFTVSGVTSHAMGTDNSDGDKLKITPNASTPGGVANSGIIILPNATPLVGINKDVPAHPLDVTGRARANQFCQLQANPTVTMGSAAGTGATGSCTGGANSFQISFTTGTGPTASGILFSVTLPTAFPAVLHFVWSARNAQAATDLNKFFVSAFSASQITVSANGALAASTQYILYFVGCGY